MIKLNNYVVDDGYIRPKNANKLMKAAQSIRQTVYIYGTTGYGKTSFVADFLSRRKYEYYSISDATLENSVADKSGRVRIVVVDDLHLLVTSEDRKRQYEILEQLAGDLDVWLILISRCPIPAWLKPLYIQRIFVTIGEQELSFMEKEEETYLEKWELTLMLGSAKRLRQLAGGYPLFLRIAAMQLRSLPENINSSKERLNEELMAIEQARKDLWDYFETQIYDNWDVELQEFLMDISVVESFDLPMAQLVTKKGDAGRFIVMAQETGNFLLEYKEGDRTVYELRTPMKLSMGRRLTKRCTQAHIEGLYYSAGNSYELQGKIPEALGMYKLCHNQEGISRLLIENTRKYAGSGHYWELRKYYLTLSEDNIQKSSELMLGMSLLQSILLNDEESERWYGLLEDYAKKQTGSAKKAAQARLLYLDIALPQRGAARLLNILKHAWTFITEQKTLLPEMSLTNNQPSIMHGGKDFCEWSKRDRELARTIGKTLEILLGNFGKGLVNLSLAESFFEKGGDNYEVSDLAQNGRMQALSGGKLEQVFVAIGLLSWLSILNNRIEDALESLESFRISATAESPQLLPGIDTLKVRFLLYTGRSGEIANWMELAPDEDSEFCTLERYRYITKVRVYLSTGRKEKALSLLQRLLLYAQKRERTYLEMEVKILIAITQFRQGEKNWQETLQDVITQAESYHFVRVFTIEGVAIWELLKTADFIWQDVAYKKQILKECEQMAKLYPAYLSEKHDGNVLLSDKALMVLRLQAEGLSVEQIAKTLVLSKAGVKYYNQETYKKLGVSSKAAAINEARNRNIL